MYKRATYLEIALTKQVKDLYDKSFKPLKKEIGEDIKIQTDLPCSLISRINIINKAILPKSTCRFNAILIKIPAQFFTNLDKQYSTSFGKTQTPRELTECFTINELPEVSILYLKFYYRVEFLVISNKMK